MCFSGYCRYSVVEIDVSPLSSRGLRWGYLARTLIYICMVLLYDMCHMVTAVGSVKNILLKYS